MPAEICSTDFEQDTLPHLQSAYNLARWLTRNEQDAEDLVQEAYLRAFRFYHHFRGGDARPWLLKIVRNAFYSRGRRNQARRFVPFDADAGGREWDLADEHAANPEEVLMQKNDGLFILTALEALPSRAREILVLRGLEGLSYREISMVTGVPAGTVMSSLSRARARLREAIADCKNAESVAR